MKRVWGIALFFFAVGILTGMWIRKDTTQFFICAGSIVGAYCLFFR